MKKKIVRIYKYEENKNSYKTLIDKIISISLCTKILKNEQMQFYIYTYHIFILHILQATISTRLLI